MLYDASVMTEEEVVERYYDMYKDGSGKLIEIPVACFNMQQRLSECVKSSVEQMCLNRDFNIRRTTTSIMSRLGIKRTAN
jgi:hypothetical protein